MKTKQNSSLKSYNTFAIEAKAMQFIEIEDVSELVSIFDYEQRPEKFFLIGGGSNLLFTKDFDGSVIKLNNKGIDLFFETDEHVILRVQAGEIWDDFVNYCVENNLYGVENLSLIPGTVGAAPVQNIGAYGVELKDILYSCTVFDTETSNFQTFTNEECEFGYRWSMFKKSENLGRYIITSVQFILSKQADFKLDYGNLQDEISKFEEVSLKSVRQAVIQVRQSKLPDPTELPNAGSFFKNPTISTAKFQELKASTPNLIGYPQQADTMKLAAGQLIDLCGLKSYKLGNAAVHDRQALVLISNGLATGQDILNLAKHVQARVFEKFCINLEPEVNIL